MLASRQKSTLAQEPGSRRAAFAVCLLALAIAGCDKRLVPLISRADAEPISSAGDAAPADGPARAPTWGAYAASLDVPLCEGPLSLEVTTSGSELDGGEALDDPARAGAQLSLLEALQIAANREDRVAIHFSEAVFPAAEPAIIALPDSCALPVLDNVCIDGRARGVVIDFFAATSKFACTLDLRRDSLLVGLELRRLRWQVTVAGGSQVAGCRLNSDGLQATLASEPETVVVAGNATIGPGNSFGNTEGVRLRFTNGEAPFSIDIHGNHFGIDPVTGAEINNQFGILAQGWNATALAPLRIRNNVFRGWEGIRLGNLVPGSRVEVAGNDFGRPSAEVLTPTRGLSSAIQLDLEIGPDNRFVGLDVAIELSQGAATIKRNVINACAKTIVLAEPPVAAPSIDDASSAVVQGQCAAPGLVEVFGTRQDQADVFLGQTVCGADGSWRLGASIAHPYVTATLTTSAGTSALSSARSTARGR